MGAMPENDFLNRCINCMADKGEHAKCPECGYDEGRFVQEALYLRPRTILNTKYLCGLPLGKGGFGITYIGWDIALERKLAIKEFFPSALATRHQNQSTVLANSSEEQEYLEIGLRMFLDEARRVAQFHHVDGIVTVHDFYEENSTAYMVMEYLSGSDLHAFLRKQGGRLALDQTLDLIHPVLQALKHIHAGKVYHRDISAQNIIVTDQGQPKLIDFGAAKYTVRERSDTVRVVKAGYSPLEQYSSRGKIGPWTDIYALGATLYLLLSGDLPPESPDRYYKDDLVPLSEYDGLDVPEHINQAVLHCLSVKFDDRYQKVDELEAALFAGGHPVASQTDTVALQPPPPVPPEPPTEIAPPSSGPPKQEPSRGKTKKAVLLAAVLGALALGLVAFLLVGKDKGSPKPSAPAPAAAVAVGAKVSPKPQDAKQRTAKLNIALAKADEHLKANRLAEAERDYKKALEVDPKSQKARQGIQAVAEARQSVQQDKRYKTLLQKGRQSLAQGKLATARDSFQQALRIRPKAKEAQQGLETARKRIAADQQAKKYAELLRQGEENLAQGKLEQAQAYFQQALQIKPQATQARQGLKTAQERIAKAQKEKQYQELMRQGRSSLAKGKLEQAKDSFQQALNIKPQSEESRQALESVKNKIAAKPSSAPPVVEHGKLLVGCQPVAKVFMDGQLLGTTPLGADQIPVGKHSIKVKGFGAVRSVEVYIEKGQKKEIRLLLKGGTLSVNSAPWAEILLDGQKVGYTPLRREGLVLGPHVVTAQRDGFQTQRKHISFQLGKPVSISFQLRRKLGD
jgi:serine/threonine protein kinase/tetratricopeptide (TPR) repeat protein